MHMLFIVNVIWHVCVFMNVNCLCLLSITIMYFIFSPVSPAGVYVEALSVLAIQSTAKRYYYRLLYIYICIRACIFILVASAIKQIFQKMQIHPTDANITQTLFRASYLKTSLLLRMN